MVDENEDDLARDLPPFTDGDSVVVLDTAGAVIGHAHRNPRTGGLEIDNVETTVVDETRDNDNDVPGGFSFGHNLGGIPVVDGGGAVVGSAHCPS